MDSSSSEGIVFSNPIRKSKGDSLGHRQPVNEVLRFFDPPEKTAMLRFKLYQKELERVEDEVEKLEKCWYGGFLREVVEFVNSSSPCMFEGEAEIPIGFLKTGLPADETRKLFQSILQCIQSQGNTHLVARLSSKQCPSVKVGFENIFKQLVERDENAGESTHELKASFDELNLSKIKEASAKRGNRYSSIYDLRKWYMDRFPDFETQCKRDFISMQSTLLKFETLSTTSEKSKSNFRKSSDSIEYNCTSAKKPRLEVSDALQLITDTAFIYDSNGKYDSNSSDSDSSEIYLKASTENDFFMETDSKIFSSRSFLDKFPQAQYRQKPKTIVVLIEAADFFQRRVLQDLLQLLSCSTLPIILLIGVTYYLDNLEHIVPTGSTFLYKLFTTIEARQRLSDFMDKVVCSLGTPLRLSGSIVKYMSNAFLCHDFSITRLKQIYKICLLQYYRAANSILSSRNAAQNISDSFSMTLRTVKSFKGCQNRSRSPKKSNEPDINTIQRGLQKYRDALVSFFATLHFFSEFAAGLPNSPFGENLVDLYSLAWDGGMLNPGDENDNRSLLQQFVSLLQQFGSEEMNGRLNKGITVLEKFHADNMNFEDWSDESILRDLIVKMKEFRRKLRDASEEQMKVDQEQKLVLSPKKSRSSRVGMTTLQLKEFNKKQIEISKKKRATVFEILKEEIVSYLTKLADTHFKPVWMIPFSEVFVYDDLEYLKSNVSVSLQSSIHKTLTLPGFHQDTRSNEMNLSTSVVYNLFAEGRMKTVNLNDLYGAFKFKSSDEIGQSQSVTSKRPSARRKRSITEDELLVRFRQSVAELQIFGLMKPSPSNPDEFLRLSWMFSIEF